jgi:hypothetical protein
MTDLTPISFEETDIDRIAGHAGRVAVLLDPEGRMDTGARRVNKLMRGALERMTEGAAFAKAKPGQVLSLAYPSGMAAEGVDVAILPKNADVQAARKAGAALARRGAPPIFWCWGAITGALPKSSSAWRCGITTSPITRVRLQKKAARSR